MGFEPMNLVLTKDALYRLSYSSVRCLPQTKLIVWRLPAWPARPPQP